MEPRELFNLQHMPTEASEVRLPRGLSRNTFVGMADCGVSAAWREADGAGDEGQGWR